MSYINDFILSVVFLGFPIMSYLFYVAYNKNIGKEENKITFCFALFSSIYLILNMSLFSNYIFALFIAISAIIISYIRNCLTEAIIISLFYILVVIVKYEVLPIILFIEVFLFLIYYLIKKKNLINEYIFVILCYVTKCIILMFTSYNININDLILILLISLMVNYIIIFMLKKGDAILKYHLAYKELIQEKQIRTSLFKITHEIKNPLAVCKGYFSMLDIDNYSQCKKYIPIIKEEVNHALMILNDFSDLSKIKINKEIVDIDYILQEAIDNLSEFAKNNDITLEYNGKDEVYIEGDYIRLIQVFINIMKNSIEALELKKNKKISIDLVNNENDINIIFEDNGCGMSEDILKDFDKPFYTTKQNGTGLGTVLSKEIIVAHGGEIKYESIYKKGTKVTISLPKISI